MEKPFNNGEDWLEDKNPLYPRMAGSVGAGKRVRRELDAGCFVTGGSGIGKSRRVVFHSSDFSNKSRELNRFIAYRTYVPGEKQFG